MCNYRTIKKIKGGKEGEGKGYLRIKGKRGTPDAGTKLRSAYNAKGDGKRSSQGGNLVQEKKKGGKRGRQSIPLQNSFYRRKDRKSEIRSCEGEELKEGRRKMYEKKRSQY